MNTTCVETGRKKGERKKGESKTVESKLGMKRMRRGSVFEEARKTTGKTSKERKRK